MQQHGCIPQLRAKQNLSKLPANPSSIWFSFQKAAAWGKHLTQAALHMLHLLLLSKPGPCLNLERWSGPFFPFILCLFTLPCPPTLFKGLLLPLRKDWPLPPSSSNVSYCCPFLVSQSMFFKKNLNTSWSNEWNQRSWRETVQMKQIINLTTLQTFAASS